MEEGFVLCNCFSRWSVADASQPRYGGLSPELQPLATTRISPTTKAKLCAMKPLYGGEHSMSSLLSHLPLLQSLPSSTAALQSCEPSLHVSVLPRRLRLCPSAHTCHVSPTLSPDCLASFPAWFPSIPSHYQQLQCRLFQACQAAWCGQCAFHGDLCCQPWHRDPGTGAESSKSTSSDEVPLQCPGFDHLVCSKPHKTATFFGKWVLLSPARGSIHLPTLPASSQCKDLVLAQLGLTPPQQGVLLLACSQDTLPVPQM